MNNAVFYSDFSVPRSLFRKNLENDCETKKTANKIYQYISLVLAVVLLSVGGAYWPKCACIGINALVSLGCGMSLVIIAAVILNVMLYLEGIHLEKKKRFFQTSNRFEITDIIRYFSKGNATQENKQALIHNIDPKPPNGIELFMKHIQDRIKGIDQSINQTKASNEDGKNEKLQSLGNHKRMFEEMLTLAQTHPSL